MTICDHHCDLLSKREKVLCKSHCGNCVKLAEQGGDIVGNCQKECTKYTGADKDLCDDACLECGKFAKE